MDVSEGEDYELPEIGVCSTLWDKEVRADHRHSKEQSKIIATRSEIWSWYSNDFGNESMVSVFLAMLYPTILVTMSQRYGCAHNTDYGCDYDNNAIGAKSTSNTVTISLGTWNLRPAAFAAIMIAFGGAIQGIVYVGMGAIADFENYKYYLFRISTVLSCATMCIWIFFTNQVFLNFCVPSTRVCGPYTVYMLPPNKKKQKRTIG